MCFVNGCDLDSARFKMRADRAAGTEKSAVQVSMCAGTCLHQSRFSHASIVGINSAPKKHMFCRRIAAVRKPAHRREKFGYIVPPPPPHRRRSPSPPLLPIAAAKVCRPPRRRRSPSPPRSAALPVAAAPRAVRPKMTPRFRRLLAVSRGQAPRPGVVEDRSSSEHQHRRIWSTKTVSAFWHFPHPKSP